MPRNVIGPLSSEEAAAIKRGDSAIVMLRVTVEDQDGNPWDHPFIGPFDSRNYGRLPVGGFDTGGQLKYHDIRNISEDAWNEGWLTLLLPPGYYYFASALFPYPSSVSVPVRVPRRWRIEVPPGAPVVYAGTFHLSGKVSTPLFDRKQLVGVNGAATRIDDETALAAEIARRDLPSLPPPVTRLAVLHTGPILLDMPPPVSQAQ
jgi:hypothetical protein